MKNNASNYNKLKFVITIFVALVITLIGCKKDEDANLKTVIKYEINSSSLILGGKIGSATYTSHISYTDELGNRIDSTLKTSYKSWSKEVVIQQTQRPFKIYFGAVGVVESLPADVSINVYLNGIRKRTINPLFIDNVFNGAIRDTLR
jgi:hypothetical protein